MASRIAAGIALCCSLACGGSGTPVSIEADTYTSHEQLLLAAGGSRRTIETEAPVDFDRGELRDGACVIELVDGATVRAGAVCDLEREGLKLQLSYLFGQVESFPAGVVISATGTYSEHLGLDGTFAQTRIVTRSSRR